MISGSANEFAALADQLVARAEAIARAKTYRKGRDAKDAPDRWRHAEYLWPDLAGG